MSIVRFQIFQNTGGDSPCSPISLAAIADTSKIVTAYSDTPTASGGTAPYTYTISAGSLPTGLTINSNTGLISGTTTITSATYSFTVQAEDANGCTGSQAYSIEVNEFYNYLEEVTSNGDDLTGSLPAAYKQLFIDLNTDREDIIRVNTFATDTFTGFNLPLIKSVDGVNQIGAARDTNNGFVSGDWDLLIGLTGDGASKYLDTGINPSTTSELGLNSTSIGAWVSTVNNGRIVIGALNGGNVLKLSWAFTGYSGAMLANINDGYGSNSYPAQTAGFCLVSRTNGTEHKLYKNGVNTGTFSVASSAKPNANIDIFRRTDGYYSNDVCGGYIIAKGLTAAAVARINTAFSTFFTAIGR